MKSNAALEEEEVDAGQTAEELIRDGAEVMLAGLTNADHAEEEAACEGGQGRKESATTGYAATAASKDSAPVARAADRSVRRAPSGTTVVISENCVVPRAMRAQPPPPQLQKMTPNWSGLQQQNASVAKRMYYE